MNDRMKTNRDYQLKDAVRLVVLKQSPDGQPFWPITSNLIHSRRRYQYATNIGGDCEDDL